MTNDSQERGEADRYTRSWLGIVEEVDTNNQEIE